MIYRIIFLTLLFFSFSYSAFQEVRIGKIDNYYADTLSPEELRAIIDEIEDRFESQLGYDVFDYSQTGKPIDILYVQPDRLEKSILRKIERLEKKQEKISSLRNSFPSKQKRIEEYQKNINVFATHINDKTEELNIYVRDINRKKTLSVNQYKQAQVYVKNKQNRINRDVHVLKQDRRTFKRMLSSYNKKINNFNNLIRDYNMLQNEIERMNRSFKKVKGRTFGLKETTLKTYYKDGKKIKEKSVKNSMTKIEIYGFETINQLRAVLAHEIGHLVGIPHINVKNALMHPLLQENQIDELYLMDEDVENFNDNF